MAALLEPVQHHDGVEVADMEAGTCRIKTDIGALRAFAKFAIKGFEVRTLVNEAAFV